MFSGIMGKSAAKKQEEAIKAAQAKPSALVTEHVTAANDQIMPWRDSGNAARGTLSDILAGKVNLDDVVGQSSLFKFQQETGTRDINRQLRARGLYGSGAGLESLAKFENQLLDEEGEPYMGRLFQMSNTGLQAAGSMSANDLNKGNTLANIAMQGGLQQANARYQGDMAIAGMGKGSLTQRPVDSMPGCSTGLGQVGGKDR